LICLYIYYIAHPLKLDIILPAINNARNAEHPSRHHELYKVNVDMSPLPKDIKIHLPFDVNEDNLVFTTTI